MNQAYLAKNLKEIDSQSCKRCSGKGLRGWRAQGKFGVAWILFLLLGAVILSQPSLAMADSGAAAAQVSVGISVRFGPPPLPVYAQPMCPGPGYIWTPGYWAWDPQIGYYWVPGTWVMAPFVGALWTPGYWGWSPAVALFVWHSGYWGPRVGFYGGINYGYGYTGYGYEGGYWRGGVFFYNRDINRIDVNRIRHVYRRRIVVRNDRRISYNGGHGGIMARPTREDFQAERDRRMGPDQRQVNHERMARGMPELRWSRNRGRPDIAATPRPEMFRGRGVSRATRSGGAYAPERTRQSGAQPRERQPRGPQPREAQPRGQPTPRRQPERRNQPRPNRNERPATRNQGQPQYRGQQGRGQPQQQQKGERSRGKQKGHEEPGRGGKGKGHEPHG